MSARLRRQIKELGASHKQPLHSSLPIYMCWKEGNLAPTTSRPLTGETSIEEFPRQEHTYSTERLTAEHTLDSFQWARGEELPSTMSLYLYVWLFLHHPHDLIVELVVLEYSYHTAYISTFSFHFPTLSIIYPYRLQTRHQSTLACVMHAISRHPTFLGGDGLI
ncbi:hypothetical protein DL93DRAFT_2084085 [Clavulina sp. PMI_390]|nr:hypothetical protein DL93DRAFT_2084085 [Clavulina sp. PMI_390]